MTSVSLLGSRLQLSCLSWYLTVFHKHWARQGSLDSKGSTKTEGFHAGQTDLCIYEIRKKNLLDFVITVILFFKINYSTFIDMKTYYVNRVRKTNAITNDIFSYAKILCLVSTKVDPNKH